MTTRTNGRSRPRKGDEHDNGAATLPEETPTETATTETNGTTEPGNGNGNGHQNGERKPVKVFSYLIGPDTYVQCSIWQRDANRRDGTPFTTWDCSIRKRYLDQRDANWKSVYSFHASELYAVTHALTQASSYIAELRAADIPF